MVGRDGEEGRQRTFSLLTRCCRRRRWGRLWGRRSSWGVVVRGKEVDAAKVFVLVALHNGGAHLGVIHLEVHSVRRRLLLSSGGGGSGSDKRTGHGSDALVHDQDGSMPRECWGMPWRTTQLSHVHGGGRSS